MPGREMAKVGYMQPIPKGTVIFQEQDQGAEMYIVLQGSVEIGMESHGKQIKLAEIAQGGFFGEMSLLEGLRRTATAVTSCDSVLMVITKNNFDEVISKNPEIALRIMKGLSSRIRELNKRLKEAAGKLEAIGKQDATGNQEAEDFDDESDLEEVVTEVDPKVLNFYFYNKEVACPVCGHKFATLVIRESKLRKKDHTNELRIFYHDVDPLLYNIWVCPQCYYAMPKSSFENLDANQKKILANQDAQRKGKYKLAFSSGRTAGFALKVYKIALECCESLGKKNVDVGIAELWLNVAWLYDDLQKAEKAQQAREQALLKYKNTYSQDAGSEEQCQRLEYIIGSLAGALGNRKEAREYMFKAVSRRNGHALIKDIAKDALRLLKESEPGNS